MIAPLAAPLQRVRGARLLSAPTGVFGFKRKAQKTPKGDLDLARKRQKKVEGDP